MKDLLIILSLFLSCRHDLQERHYKTTDEMTGGFNNFSLDLYSNGNLELTIETSKAIEEKETETVWEKQSKTVTGKWNMKNEIIDYSLDLPKTSIDSVFINTNFSDFVKNPILIFSPKSDTAYIYGIPCLLVEKK